MYGGADEVRITFKDFLKESDNHTIFVEGTKDKFPMKLPYNNNNKNRCFDNDTPLTYEEFNTVLPEKSLFYNTYSKYKTNIGNLPKYSLQTNLKLTDVIYKQKDGQYASDIFNQVENSIELKLLFNQIITKPDVIKTTTNEKALTIVETKNEISPKNKIKLYKIINKLFRLNIKKSLIGGWVKMDWPESKDTEDISEEVDILHNDEDGMLLYGISDNNGIGYCVMDGNAIRKFKLIVGDRDKSETIKSIAENEGDEYTHTIEYTLKQNGDVSISLDCTLTPKR